MKHSFCEQTLKTVYFPISRHRGKVFTKLHYKFTKDEFQFLIYLISVIFRKMRKKFRNITYKHHAMHIMSVCLKYAQMSLSNEKKKFSTIYYWPEYYYILKNRKFSATSIKYKAYIWICIPSNEFTVPNSSKLLK